MKASKKRGAAPQASQPSPGSRSLIVAAFAARTWARNSDWRDDVSLMTAAAETSPNSYKSHRAHTCAAVAATIQLYLRIQRRDLAEKLKDSSRDFGCPAGPLNQLLQEGSPR
jgi:hypothetical protein